MKKDNRKYFVGIREKEDGSEEIIWGRTDQYTQYKQLKGVCLFRYYSEAHFAATVAKCF